MPQNSNKVSCYITSDRRKLLQRKYSDNPIPIRNYDRAILKYMFQHLKALATA